MDNSKEYIEQCRKAVEVQESQPRISGWPPEIPNMYWIEEERVYCSKCQIFPMFDESFCSKCGAKTTHEVHGITYTAMHQILNSTVVWLPRQDQLQKIIEDHLFATPSAVCLQELFYIYLKKDGKCEGIFYNYSMEQLWLAFVMHEKFNKTWNGEDWVEKA